METEKIKDFTIVDLEDLAAGVTLFEVHAPRIAARHKAGQFVMIRPRPDSERIPLTIANTDRRLGTITLVVQGVGKTTIDLCKEFRKGDRFSNVAGPLGNPTHIGIPGKPDDYKGTVVCVAGGIGAAPILPIVKAFREAGHEVITILGARRADLIILDEMLSYHSNQIVITTDDGSFGKKGFVTDRLRELIEERGGTEHPVELAIAIGPPIMMKMCAKATEPYGVATLVSLNTIMVDGTGMCGGCRVQVGTTSKYVCVDGPEFDGHQVDFDGMMRRQSMYKVEEAESLERWKEAQAKAKETPCADDSCRAVAAAVASETNTRNA